MSKQPMAIAGLGMISCLAKGAEFNAAAMRCGYDGFQQIDFNQPYSAEKQVGAMAVTEDKQLRGIEKLAHLCRLVITEATRGLPTDHEGLQALFCLPEKSRPNAFSSDDMPNTLIEMIRTGMTPGVIDEQPQVYRQHRCGFITALRRAQEALYEQRRQHVLIVSADSLLDSQTLSYYSGALYGEGRRLLGDDHANGFIPGEAAVAVLLSTPENASSEVIISGVGTGEETATLENEDEVLTGKGLADAIDKASQDAGVEIHDTAFRVASVSGEDYFFTEASLAQAKTLKQTVPGHPLWHPADNIGEVGAAIGGAMAVMTYYAFIKHYAPGPNALCHISNDDPQRGAFTMQHQPINQGI